MWRRFFRRKEIVEPGRVSLIMTDGTVVSPPSEGDLDEKFRYLTGNLIPGVGNPEDGDSNEG